MTIGCHALRFVLPDDDTVTVLDQLRGRLRMLGVRTNCLFLDKGFAGTAVLAYLTAHRQPALIACPIRGKTGGTRALCRGQSSYRTRHTFTADGKRRFTVEVAVCCTTRGDYFGRVAMTLRPAGTRWRSSVRLHAMRVAPVKPVLGNFGSRDNTICITAAPARRRSSRT